jgi:type VI protein secretion system component VasF
MNAYERGQEQIFESVAPATATAMAPSEVRIEEKPAGLVLDSDIITKSMPPDQAYEIFQGKFFGVLRMKENEKVLTESATTKLSRIQQELQQLARDMDATTKSQKKDQTDLLKVMRKTADDLALQTLQLKTHPALNSEHTSSGLDDRLKQIQASVANDKVKLPSPSAIDEDRLSKRVNLLEAVLGSASNVLDVESVYGVLAKNRVFPLADSILGIEQRLSLLDEQNLDVLRSKAKALRIELEAVNKIASASQAAGEQRMAAEAGWKKVSDLGDKLKRLESVVDDLPALVLRLKSLEHIHQAAGTFAQRVTEIETASQNVQTQLHANRELLEVMKKGLKDNAAAMLSNVQDVDARINALKKR